MSTKRDAIRSFVNDQKGKIFTVNFIGKDGKEHVANARTGVCKFSHGGRNNAAGKEDLLTVFNVHKMAYRNVYLDGVTKISGSHQVIEF